jgi:hypothetical protein
LKTTEYLYRYQGEIIHVDAVYRFLDKLNDSLKAFVEQIAFTHTRHTLGGDINVVFYDMTTLYFEASDKDDLRKAGFSKDGKHSNSFIRTTSPLSDAAINSSAGDPSFKKIKLFHILSI